MSWRAELDALKRRASAQIRSTTADARKILDVLGTNIPDVRTGKVTKDDVESFYASARGLGIDPRPSAITTHGWLLSLSRADDAVAEGGVEVVLANPTDGSRASYGVLVRRRTCGPYRLRISHDRETGLWWITALGEDRIAVIGFREERVVQCSRLFDRLTPSQIRAVEALPS